MNEYMKKRMEDILAGRPIKTKEKKGLNKVSPKRQQKLNEQKASGTDSEMDLFFEAMRKKLKGKCLFCREATTWKNEDLWRAAIAHLFPKSKFQSIATNEENWVELCLSCHRSFDDGIISWELLHDSKEWEILKEKLLNILPLVNENERKNKLYSKIESLVYEKKFGN